MPSNIVQPTTITDNNLKNTHNNSPQHNPHNPQSPLRNPPNTNTPRTIRTRARRIPITPRLRRTSRNIRRSGRVQLIIAKHIAVPRAVVGQTIQQIAQALFLGETVETTVVGVVGDTGRGAAFGHDVGGIVFVGKGAGGVLGWEHVDAAVAGGGGGGGCCRGHSVFFKLDVLA